MDKIAESVIQIIKENRKEVANEELISLDTKMSEFNINSIEFIHLLIEIEKAFDFEFDDEDLLMNLYHTVNDFVNIIKLRIDKN